MRVSLVSLFLSLLRALGWGCSLGFCLLLREMAAGVLVGLVVGFLCRVFFFFPSPPNPLPPLVPWLRLRSEPRRRLSQEGGGSCAGANNQAGRASPARPDWLALTSSCSRGSRSWAGLGSCRGRLVQREKTGAMIPARGRTSRAGDTRRAGEKESRTRPWLLVPKQCRGCEERSGGRAGEEQFVPAFVTASVQDGAGSPWRGKGVARPPEVM